MAKTRKRPKPKSAVMEEKPVFKVGDRVTYHAGEYGNGLLNGKTGTVIYVDGTRCRTPWSLISWLTSTWQSPITGRVSTELSRDPFMGGSAVQSIWRRQYES